MEIIEVLTYRKGVVKGVSFPKSQVNRILEELSSALAEDGQKIENHACYCVEDANNLRPYWIGILDSKVVIGSEVIRENY